MTPPGASRGLEGVIAARSSVSSIIGDKLTYRGYDVAELVEHSTFEETAFLLWTGELPTAPELTSFRDEIAAARPLPAAVAGTMSSISGSGDVLDRIRTLVSLLGQEDPDAGDVTVEAGRRKSVRMLAQIPTLVAAVGRFSQGLEPIPPNSHLSLAGDFLRMLRGDAPDQMVARALDQVLVLLADHELNASTFAARVAASSLTDLHSAVLAAICTLKGPLHGGAVLNVSRLLRSLDTPGDARSWVRAAVAGKQRVPGFGHRVYRNGDPRARILKGLSHRLAQSAGETRWYDVSVRLEEEVLASLGLMPNVDFYAASVYTYLGIPPELFTPVFMLSRTSGWIAHIREQYADNRLIRPRAEYAGPSSRAYIGTENR